jgi:methionyl-tRNA synthetase
MPIEQIHDASGTNRYITTAIPYVNAAPHIGFALEVVQADTLARLYRQQGYAVRLQAGTDENSIKNVHAAEAAGIPVAELVERNAARFLALKTKLNLSYDDFIRTSTDARHRRGVERLWQACFERVISTSAPIAVSTAPAASNSTGLANLMKGAAPSMARSWS